jgi:hypothetical protein
VRVAQLFDALVRRTITKKLREQAKRRTREFLGELLLSEIRERTGKSQGEVALWASSSPASASWKNRRICRFRR